MHIPSLNFVCREISWRTAVRDGSFIRRGQPTKVNTVAPSCLLWKRRGKTDDNPLVLMPKLHCSMMRKDPVTLLEFD